MNSEPINCHFVIVDIEGQAGEELQLRSDSCSSVSGSSTVKKLNDALLIQRQNQEQCDQTPKIEESGRL